MELYTVEETAGILKLSAYTVRRLLREGKLRGIKVGAGQQWRIRRGDLDHYLGVHQEVQNRVAEERELFDD